MRNFEKSILALAFAISPAAYGAGGNIMLQNLMPEQEVYATWQQPLSQNQVNPQVLAVVSDAYWTNVGEDQEYTHATRHLNGVRWKAGQGALQEVKFPSDPLKVVNRVMNTVFTAKPGDEIAATFDYAFRKQDGAWMNGFVYGDWNNDGEFDQTLNSELMTYSYHFNEADNKGYDSKGNENNGSQVDPPTFNIPANIQPGIYRVRYKVDWSDLNPAGGPDIIKHGGAICDVLVNIHGDKCAVTVVNKNNELQAENGSAILAEYNFGEALKVKVNTPAGQIFRGIRVRHGYHLDGEQLDKNGNPRYLVNTFSADQLKKNGYTIPASCMDGNVEIEALFAAAEGDYFTNVLEGQDYNNTTGRYLSGISLNSGDGNQKIDLQAPLKVYTKLLNRSFKAKAGEEVTAVFDFSTNWMNGYVYIDRNNDGNFDQQLGSEVMAYSHLGGKDSKGNNANGGQVNPPAFTLPNDLKPGIYRMRYKVDWDNIDPAGNIAEGNDIIKNGGAICDVLLNIHTDECKVTAAAVENCTVLDAAGAALNGVNKAFGQELKSKLNVASGFVCKDLKVRHGYNLTGAQIDAHGNPQYQEEVIPGYQIKNGEVTLPAAYLDGEVLITPTVAAAAVPTGGDYALNFGKETLRGETGLTLKTVTFQAQQGGTSVVAVPAEDKAVYQDLMNQSVAVFAGDVVRVATDVVGADAHYYLYVDLNEDGQLLPDLATDGQPTPASELLSYTYLNGKNSQGKAVELTAVDMQGMPTFQLPEGLAAGGYRARLKVDYNNSEAGGSAEIASRGGYVVDFLLNVSAGDGKLSLHTLNGNVYGDNNGALPMTLKPFQSDLKVVPTPVAAGYTAQNMTIKVGHRFDGPEVVKGNRQWSLMTLPVAPYTLTKDKVAGDVDVTVNFEKGADATYNLVFSDEFNGPDGSQPDPDKWVRCHHENNSAWNRWVSQSNDVVYLQDGNLVTRAIKNPKKTTQDPGDMITGGVETRNIFTWESGKIECRAKANLHTGTFPAIWMMPENQDAGWPNDGEIDIFEAINNDQKAYHTIHTNWTYNLHKGGNGSNVYASHDRYHTYGLEWTPTALKFFLDGKHVWTYNKSTNQNDLNQGQWPFARNFYLILNQSVGNGSWAANPDINHTYEFFIDWIRVYQTSVDRSKSDLQTALYNVKGCAENDEVNGYVVDHAKVDAAKEVFATSQNVDELNRATADVKAAAVINQPKLNNFYRLRCAQQLGNGDDMKYLQSTQTEGKQNMVFGEAGKGAEATFLYTADGLLSYTQGLYCGGEALLNADGTATAVFQEAQNGRRGCYNVKLGDQFIYGSEATLKTGVPTRSDAFNWWLEPVSELQVNFEGNAASGFYATLYSPMDLTLPAGVKAYVGKQQNGVLTLTERSEERRVGKECRSRWSPYH